MYVIVAGLKRLIYKNKLCDLFAALFCFFFFFFFINWDELITRDVLTTSTVLDTAILSPKCRREDEGEEGEVESSQK